MHRDDIEKPRGAREAGSAWTGARFPNSFRREEFIEQLRLWNRIEDLPQIHFRTLQDGVSLSYSCVDYRRIGLRRLVDSHGGHITYEPTATSRFNANDVEAAFACC